ncbi:MAG: leucyl aminopeptidase [Candidatus Binatia bacterium]
MEVKFRDVSPERIKTDLLVLPVAERELAQPVIRAVDRLLKGALSERIKKGKFTGADGSALLHSTNGIIPASYLLLLGMGKERELETDSWRKAAARARKEASGVGATEMVFSLPSERESTATAGAIVEGAALASYQFNKYRSEAKPFSELRLLTLARPGLKRTAALDRSVRMAQDLMPGVFLARDLVNEPPSKTTPRYLGEQAERHCRGRGLRVEVWGKKKIDSMNLAGLLAVNRGSVEEPRFILLRYRPQVRAKKKVALVGKGITFDSGGLSLKPAKSMETMKLDMSGAAAIIGAMSVIDKLSPPVEVKAYIPCTDNLPSGSAQKPGDVIRYLNGKTVEVLNTDAEGRLILADGLALAARERPDCMLNLATLTGACMVALGTEVAGIFGNQQLLVDEVIRCGKEAGEKLWQLPLVKEYRDEIKSSVADIKNIGGSYGGAITAALFLQEFVGDIPWAHLDIAGPAFAEKDLPTSPKGGTGFGVLTLLRFLARVGQDKV